MAMIPKGVLTGLMRASLQALHEKPDEAVIVPAVVINFLVDISQEHPDLNVVRWALAQKEEEVACPSSSA